MRYSPLCCILFGLILLLATVISGCSPETRHQVLTVFFTGVPPLGGDTELNGEDGGVTVSRQAFPRRYERGGFTHGPYAARECGTCHEMVPPPRAGEKPTRIVVGQFVRERQEMCIACHTEKSDERARADGLWRHGPAGNCLGCHHPHASPDPSLLRRDAGEQCLSCHSEGLIHSAEMHEGLTACMDCHNPHLGQDAMMLRWDYEETF